MPGAPARRLVRLPILSPYLGAIRDTGTPGRDLRMTIVRSLPRWRVLAAVALACSAILAPAAAEAASASHAPPASHARPQTAECNSGDTYVWLALAADAATGTIYYPVEFTNTGSHSCWLQGFPGVSGLARSSPVLCPA